MKTIITLNSSKCALCDLTEPVVLPESLEITFVSNVYKLSNLALVVTVKNGKEKKQYKAHFENDYTIDISEMLKMGVIDIEISACIRGNSVKEWRVPSIFIKEIEHNFELIPEIEELKSKLNLQANAISELKKLIENQGVIS